MKEAILEKQKEILLLLDIINYTLHWDLPIFDPHSISAVPDPTYHQAQEGITYSSNDNGILKVFQFQVMTGICKINNDEYGFEMSINKANDWMYNFKHDPITDNIRNPLIFVVHEDGRAKKLLYFR